VQVIPHYQDKYQYFELDASLSSILNLIYSGKKKHHFHFNFIKTKVASNEKQRNCVKH
jgi:hypothetical protein